MKRRIRERYFCRGLDKDIEKFIDSCDGCKLMAVSLPSEPLKRTDLPDQVWQKIAIDFNGPVPSGEKLLVVVNYYSRYVEVKVMETTEAGSVIRELEEVFSRLGYPEEIISDNGPPFQSEEFDNWCTANGIWPSHSLRYCPWMNEAVEVNNKGLNKVITICVATGSDWRRGMTPYLEAILWHPG